MRDKVTKTAYEKGFIVRLTNGKFYYLWLCLLQKWLRDAYNIHVEPCLRKKDYSLNHFYFDCNVKSHNNDCLLYTSDAADD